MRFARDTLVQKHQISWRNSVLNMPKLRTYRNINETFCVQPYIKTNISRQDRSTIARLRCGVFPIELELGRYRGISVERRLCKMCSSNSIEDEKHLLIHCSKYDVLRINFVNKYEERNNCDFTNLSDDEKLKLILSADFKIVAKYITDICKLRLS